MHTRVAILAAVVACSSSTKSRDVERARELIARADGTTVFGPTAEFVASDLPDVRASGLFPARGIDECSLAILPGGEDSFAARMALLASAKKSIRIQALIFTADEAGLRIAEVLKAKKQAGLDVRIIVDGLNNPSLQTQWMYFDLKQHGIEVEGYEALGLQLVNEIPIPLLTPHYDALRANNRYHEKLWIVDEARAVMGGLNIANEYFRVDPNDIAHYWRDQDVLVDGAIIADLVATFERNYAHFKDMKKRRGGLTDAAWDATRKILAKTGKPTIKHKQRDDLVKAVAALEARPVPQELVAARCRFFQSRPRLKESYIHQAYLKLLASAKHEVLIANAYFVPTIATRMAIEKAARRCVRVVVLTNGAETSDTPGMSLLGRGHYAELLAVNAQLKCQNPHAGVEIWEWQGKARGDAKQTQGLLHAKFAVADKTIAIVGSFNLDPRSERINSESAIAFESAALAGQLAQTYLERDLATSRRISAEEAATFERPPTIMKRFKKDFAGLFEDQL
jgi:cardiolipin synthase C